MKTAVRGISLLLATVLSVGVFVACDSSGKEADKDKGKDEKIPTVEEVLEKIKDPKNVKVSFDAEIDMEIFGFTVHSVTKLEAEQNGDLMHQITTTTSKTTIDGEEASETEKVESYQKLDGSNVTVYTKDEETGSWETKTGSAEELGTTVGLDDMDALFKSENFGEYDKSTGRYTLKEGVTVEVEEATVTAAYIEYKDGSYTVYVEMNAGEGMIAKTTMKYYDFGKASVKLPKGIGE